ncbi:MAG: LytTR family DNA-binding domain-containing protein [Gammaproteobacteria bacterium]|nr:LytTR family DNA-binding domain-containing protein [Gammaproteobacteria bacterium]
MDDREPPGDVRGLASLQWAHRAALEGGVVVASLIVVLVLAVAFALAGRVEQGGLSLRVLLWITCAVVCWPVCHAVAAVILYLTRSLPPVAIAVVAACGTFFFTLFCTAVGYTAYGMFYPARAEAVPLLAMYVNVTLLTVVASAFLHFVVCQMASRRAAPEEGAPPEGRDAAPVVSAATAPAGDHASWFFERLPSELGRDLVCLSVSGHYLEVVTSEGSCLVLLPLSDAVKALGEQGMQVHRSHWVAHRHVVGMMRRGHRTLLQVTGEREVPVSRSRVAEVRQAMCRYGE